MLRPCLLILAFSVARGADAEPVRASDPRSDNPRYVPEALSSSGPSSLSAVPLADPQADLALERRARVSTLLSLVSSRGIRALKATDQEWLMSLWGSDLLLLPEDQGAMFRALTLTALNRELSEPWWPHMECRSFVEKILQAISNAHVADSAGFIEPFDHVGMFEVSARHLLSLMPQIINRAETFSEIDQAERLARNAYAILATTGRAPVSSFQELPVFAEIVRRREALKDKQ